MHGAGTGTKYGGDSVLSDAVSRYVTTTPNTTAVIIKALTKCKSNVIDTDSNWGSLLFGNLGSLILEDIL